SGYTSYSRIVALRFISPAAVFFFFSSRRRHTRCLSDWSSDVCSSDLKVSVECRVKFSVVAEQHADGFIGINDAEFEVRAEGVMRSEERRVGKEWRSRWSA